MKMGREGPTRFPDEIVVKHCQRDAGELRDFSLASTQLSSKEYNNIHSYLNKPCNFPCSNVIGATRRRSRRLL